MAVTTEQIAFVTDLFADVGGISTRKMMGGLTVYSDGQVFAILSSSGQIYIKAKDRLAAEMADAGSEIFSMVRKDGSSGSMGYWTLPDSSTDNPEEACQWARKSLISNS